MNASGQDFRADQRLSLIHVQRGVIHGRVDLHLVGGVRVSSEVALVDLVGVRVVVRVADAEDVGPRGGGRQAALPVERSRSRMRRGVGEDADRVDVRARTLEGEGSRLGKRRGGRVVGTPLREVEDATERRGSGGRIDEALAIRNGGSDHGHVGVEVHLGLSLGEVQLHGEDVRGGGELAAGAQHTVEGEAGGGSGGRRRGRDGTLGHVITVHFLAIHIGNDTITVLQLQLVGSHVRQTGELLAEVLRAAGGSGSRAESDLLPASIGEVQRVPGGIDRSGSGEHLPGIGLGDGVVEGEGILLLSGLGQEVLEHGISVKTVSSKPGSRRPGVAVAVDKSHGVLAVGARRQAVLKSALLIVGEGRAALQNGRTRKNLEGLFVTIASTLLYQLHIDLITTAGQAKRGRN